MSIEAGVLVDLACEPIYWHLPLDRSGGALPDSRPLWDVIWENRERLLGFAHSHPGSGIPGPSHEDVTTFAAVEAALGKRLVWWITSADSFVELCWAGPGKLDYDTGSWPPYHQWAACYFGQPFNAIIDRLRKESNY